MAFWNETSVEPKRNYRFQVEITGLEGDSVIWWAKTFKPPSYEISEVVHDYLDNKYYFPGRLTWADVNMTLIDPVSPNAVALTNKLIESAGYNVKTSVNQKETMSKASSTSAVKNVVVSILNANGDAIEVWTLKNSFLKSVSFSDLSYDNDDLRTIDLTFRYDWAECDNTGASTEDGEQFTTTS
tara:strand:- start:335 stop:886 length:552 start_codon:yes stop_codon:yes gene_type:complete